jgi:hypothetical protein
VLFAVIVIWLISLFILNNDAWNWFVRLFLLTVLYTVTSVIAHAGTPIAVEGDCYMQEGASFSFYVENSLDKRSPAKLKIGPHIYKGWATDSHAGDLRIATQYILLIVDPPTGKGDIALRLPGEKPELDKVSCTFEWGVGPYPPGDGRPKDGVYR